MASYASTTDVRLIIGLSTLNTDPDWVDDTTLQYYIDKSGPLLLQDITVLEVDEILSGNIDGTNTTFETAHYPIADSNYDSSINASDVEVYSWTDADDPSTKSSLSVSTIYANEGKIVLSSAVSGSENQVTATYRFYRQDSIPMSALSIAQGYLAGWLFLSSEYILLPDQEAVGVHRWQFRKLPDARVLESYYKVMSLIKARKWEKIQSSTPTMMRR